MFDGRRLLDYLYADPAAVQAYEALENAGGHVYIVGGAIRDTILAKEPKDIDLLVSGLESERVRKTLQELPGHVTFAGKTFGVFHYHLGEHNVEVALPRTDTSTGPGHTDFSVNYDPNLSVEDDLERRDFTANAMAFDIDQNKLIDPHKGQYDITSKTLRLVNPQAFEEDPLRIVRAIVAYSVHGLDPDEYTLQEMTENASRIRHLPEQRIQKELDKLLSGTDPAGAFVLAYNTDVLDYIVPELAAGYEFDQKSAYHDLSVGDHSLAVLDYISDLTTDPDVRLAALLHDVGKPDTFWQGDDGYGHFYATPDVPGSEDHEDRGAVMAFAFMNRLNYPNARITRVVNLIQNHMFPYFTSVKGAAKFVAKAGGMDAAQDLMNLREADAHGKLDGGISERDAESIDLGRSLLDNVSTQNTAVTPSDLPINGHDLINLGIKPGPEMGQILHQLVDIVQDNPELNNRDALLQYVRGQYAN